MSAKDKSSTLEQLAEKGKGEFLEALKGKHPSSVDWKVILDEDGIIIIKADDDNFSSNVESRAEGGNIGRELVAKWLEGTSAHAKDQEQ